MLVVLEKLTISIWVFCKTEKGKMILVLVLLVQSCLDQEGWGNH